MDPDRWHQVEVLFEAALGKEPGERVAFLSQADASDEVRREVASLLAECASGLSSLDRPAWFGAICDAASAAGEPAVRLAASGHSHALRQAHPRRVAFPAMDGQRSPTS